MGLARVPFEGGQKAKHQNKQNFSGVRAILRLADLIKVPHMPIKFIYTEILQVLRYNLKCGRNGSSRFRHGLSYAAFLSARNSSAAQLSSNQAFSFIYRLLTFNT